MYVSFNYSSLSFIMLISSDDAFLSVVYSIFKTDKQTQAKPTRCSVVGTNEDCWRWLLRMYFRFSHS